jgi:hypothetical protein
MDPFTLLAGATALYNGIKSAVDAGSDVIETAEKLGGLFSKVAQITQIAASPRKKKLFESQADYEAEAVKIYAAKKKANEMAFEVKNLFISRYGPAAWDNIQREVIEMRKRAAKEAAIALKEKEEAQRDLLIFAGIMGFVIVAVGVIAVILLATH